MQIDQTTLHDLSFLQGPHAVFTLFDRCSTQDGRAALRQFVQQPPATFEALRERQSATRFWLDHLACWTDKISNGTLVMIRKFYESADTAGQRPNGLQLFVGAVLQKLFNKNTYSFIRFSVSHLVDFLQGCHALVDQLPRELPKEVAAAIDELRTGLNQPLCSELIRMSPHASQKKMLELSYRARRELKHIIYRMMEHYAWLDAQQSMARASAEHQWQLPEIRPAAETMLKAQGLFHPLLRRAIAYDIAFEPKNRFLFLTGANMSGKSTFIRALGIAALMAHIGLGVPAREMELSFLQGIITNMHAEDNIFLGESYFFAEVQRMKLTAQKLAQSRHLLVLMDELFKGTNVHDAYDCTQGVIEGLLHQRHNIMALSTHLTELADTLHEKSGMFFRYFHTEIGAEGNYSFTYTLKPGVSSDRVGYLVLKNEGVLDLLHR